MKFESRPDLDQDPGIFLVILWRSSAQSECSFIGVLLYVADVSAVYRCTVVRDLSEQCCRYLLVITLALKQMVIIIDHSTKHVR